MLQDTHGSFATYFHKYLAILVIDVEELYFPPLILWGGGGGARIASMYPFLAHGTRPTSKST